MNVEDTLVEKLLKVFSLKTLEEIDTIVAKHNEKPELRYGQKELASWVVEVLFGQNAVLQAQTISDILFSDEDKMKLIIKLKKDDIQALYKETGGCEISTSGSTQLLPLFTQCGLTSSNGEAKKFIQQ
jgi:tyrosyl-tRNA synthetase